MSRQQTIPNFPSRHRFAVSISARFIVAFLCSRAKVPVWGRVSRMFANKRRLHNKQRVFPGGFFRVPPPWRRPHHCSFLVSAWDASHERVRTSQGGGIRTPRLQQFSSLVPNRDPYGKSIKGTGKPLGSCHSHLSTRFHYKLIHSLCNTPFYSLWVWLLWSPLSPPSSPSTPSPNTIPPMSPSPTARTTLAPPPSRLTPRSLSPKPSMVSRPFTPPFALSPKRHPPWPPLPPWLRLPSLKKRL
ncbi:hypothetical protein PGUG_00230 [Meyerozyma guilliermondii ATCC 6260]|uniref:Uncharacterized protein n=1 Tax=Meyerozyma guilliermondii (strain ATCC 6260 / CBS 566 / DSM 6381 / JCM 1539 / NBRC 10279 / NRRL Y-324) TaxID=294746 RepID=A5DAC5_PICGU|nr:uncharacterized protein PGUG_00230 [Meyerozyma guilliermondii ATCC 6260]EDK36132.2 hypothetical protein PGUG_00230 [Meyerozyma guilliermondii ATCC 6260]